MVALVYHGQAVSVVARMFETSGLLQLLLRYMDTCTKLMKILWLQLFICGSCETRKWVHIVFLTRHVCCVAECVYELVGLHC